MICSEFSTWKFWNISARTGHFFRRAVLYQLTWDGWTSLCQSREQRQTLPSTGWNGSFSAYVGKKTLFSLPPVALTHMWDERFPLIKFFYSSLPSFLGLVSCLSLEKGWWNEQVLPVLRQGRFKKNFFLQISRLFPIKQVGKPQLS